MRRLVAFILLAITCLCAPSYAHEVRPSYLELRQTGEESYDVLWKVPAAGDNLRLGLHLRFPAGPRRPASTAVSLSVERSSNAGACATLEA